MSNEEFKPKSTDNANSISTNRVIAVCIVLGIIAIIYTNWDWLDIHVFSEGRRIFDKPISLLNLTDIFNLIGKICIGIFLFSIGKELIIGLWEDTDNENSSN